MTTKSLLLPIQVGNNTLKHRVVLAPLTRFRATDKAVPTDLQVEYYRQRASEGGLLITEGTFISLFAGNYNRAPGIYNQEQIEGWKKVTSAVHEKKAFIFLQLWHVGRAGSKKFNPNNEQVVSASDIPIKNAVNYAGGYEYEQPRALEIDEIKSIVQDYRQAALNAIEAGFDGVEIHSANGYLIDQFINSSSNKRTDIYGGPVENRSHFALEVVAAIADAIGPERTAIRFSPGTPYQDMHDENVIKTWSYITNELQIRHPDLAYLHFIQANARYREDGHQNTNDSLEPYRQIWKGPFISAAGFSTSIDFAFDLAEKTGNLISFGRAFIANPDLPERLRNGWEINKYDRTTFYTHEAVGYTDYPYFSARSE
ncbi:MAG: hypothetical protein EXX96DRAFT_575931 [Benjaminiella poitrasii]|nr:MAG: hypothetical protein EXX96DRAFT_575931 [Benjaminiella poitrasii]